MGGNACNNYHKLYRNTAQRIALNEPNGHLLATLGLELQAYTCVAIAAGVPNQKTALEQESKNCRTSSYRTATQIRQYRHQQFFAIHCLWASKWAASLWVVHLPKMFPNQHPR